MDTGQTGQTDGNWQTGKTDRQKAGHYTGWTDADIQMETRQTGHTYKWTLDRLDRQAVGH